MRVTCNRVLDCSGENVTVVRQASGERWTIVEGVAKNEDCVSMLILCYLFCDSPWLSLRLFQAVLENLLVLPVLQDLLFLIGKVDWLWNALQIGFSDGYRCLLSWAFFFNFALLFHGWFLRCWRRRCCCFNWRFHWFRCCFRLTFASEDIIPVLRAGCGVARKHLIEWNVFESKKVQKVLQSSQCEPECERKISCGHDETHFELFEAMISYRRELVRLIHSSCVNLWYL